MKKIQFGLIIPTERRDRDGRASFVADVNRALDLANGHFDSFWMVDHLQTDEADILESFTTLSYLDALHPQMEFGHTVVCQSFRNPALLAKMGATLQFLSGGRFVLGLGAGWNEAEYRAYGYEFQPGRVRVEQLEETLQVIRAMWTQEKATFLGKHYQINDAFCEPKPVPMPKIMIGAFKPRMLRLAAKYADWWNVSSTGAQRYRRMAEAFNRACAEVGRDPASVRRTWGGGCACAPTMAAADAIAGPQIDPENFDFIGTPQQIIEQMLPFVEMGVDYFMLDCMSFPKLTTLELLTKEVLPVLAEYP